MIQVSGDSHCVPRCDPEDSVAFLAARISTKSAAQGKNICPSTMRVQRRLQAPFLADSLQYLGYARMLIHVFMRMRQRLLQYRGPRVPLAALRARHLATVAAPVRPCWQFLHGSRIQGQTAWTLAILRKGQGQLGLFREGVLVIRI